MDGMIENVHGKFHYKKNKLHRLDGPAVEWRNRDVAYYEDGVLHRIDGPALEYIDGTSVWFYMGKNMYCSSQEKFEQLLKLKGFW